jgi:hypothetical protein
MSKEPSKHPIWIDHWHNLKYKILAKLLSTRVIRDQKLKDSIHNMTAWSLAWMDSCAKKHYTFRALKQPGSLLLASWVAVLNWSVVVEQHFGLG